MFTASRSSVPFSRHHSSAFLVALLGFLFPIPALRQKPDNILHIVLIAGILCNFLCTSLFNVEQYRKDIPGEEAGASSAATPLA